MRPLTSSRTRSFFALASRAFSSVICASSLRSLVRCDARDLSVFGLAARASAASRSSRLATSLAPSTTRRSAHRASSSASVRAFSSCSWNPRMSSFSRRSAAMSQDSRSDACDAAPCIKALYFRSTPLAVTDRHCRHAAATSLSMIRFATLCVSCTKRLRSAIPSRQP